MKRKSIITVLTLTIVLALSIFTSCNKKHKYSNEWKYDEKSHWHECTTKKHSDTTEKIPHVLTWTEKTPASVHTDKVEKGVCECGYEIERTISDTATHAYGEEWKKDASGHWHESTCDAIAPTHEVMKKDFEAHTYDEGVVTKPADYGVVGEKTFTCTKCSYSKTEAIDALDAKDNEINLADGKTLGKTYDGQIIAITKDYFVIEGNREPELMFKFKDAEDNTYTATAPTNAGEYTVKVSVEGTAEWKAASKTFDFVIAKKELIVTGTKEYDGTVTMPATLTGVIAGEMVTATITMTSKNAGATVQDVTLEGANKDNYAIKANGVTATITPMVISVDWEKEYDGSKIFTGEPAELLKGDEVTITVTMKYAYVNSIVEKFEITGKDAGNYSLAIEDVTAEIIKANIVDFEISNASAFTEFFVGATNIPDPTTDYVEIGDGYGDIDISWEIHNGDGVWSPSLPKYMVREKPGEWRVRIQYDDGINYNFGATKYVHFTVKAKPRSLTVKNFTGKTYDGTPVANFTFDKLVKKFSAASIDGVENITSFIDSGEKYVEFRRKGETLWTKVTDTYIPKNAGEYEYRIGINATDEWEAVVSDINSFTIAQVEIKLEKGYIAINNNLQNGNLFLTSYSPVAGESVALRLVNEKAGLELSDTNPNYVKKDQKKQVSIQNNLDCFKLASSSNANLKNYKLVKDPNQTSVEIAVVPSGKGTSNLITGKFETNDTANNIKQLCLYSTVKAGYFKVGHTVMVFDNTGRKLFEAKIVHVGVVNSTGSLNNVITSQSGCVIPSDGKIRIDIDVTGITYDINAVNNGTIMVK